MTLPVVETAQILPLSLRPKGLSYLVGQKLLVETFRKQMAQRPPQVFMFSGATGTGKTTIARIVAVAFQCQHQQQWGDPCQDCWKCWDTWSIHDLGVFSSEEVGKVIEISRYAPTPPSSKRVIIVDEAQRLSSSAMQLLLKPLEDPPSSTIWIICTTEPSKILPTVRRRCMSYNLKPLSPAGVSVLLQRAAKRAGITQPLDMLIEQANRQLVTSPAILLVCLEKYAAGMSAEQAVAGVEGGTTDTLQICKSVSSGDWATLRRLLQAVQPGESRWVRASVSGWLRGWLWRENNPKRQAMLAESLTDLNDGRAPLDDSALALWTIGVLYRVCRRFHVEGRV